VPSYNEADNISFVTRIIDQGLSLAFKKLPEIKEAVIVNVDNSSQDKTSIVFKKTKTFFSKASLLTKGRPGKGKNLLVFLKNNYKKYDIFITLDADLKSIEPNWIPKLLAPFLDKNKKCDFVWPLYRRSRFEGSTTNHFAYPLIYALFKIEVRQPIAGDFAFSQKLASKIISHNIPAAAYYYGIDILFSIRAVQYARYSVQIDLGNKIHKPSFSKLERMFPQVASAAVDTLRNRVVRPASGITKVSQSICITPSKLFLHKTEADKLFFENIVYLSKHIEAITWLNAADKNDVKITLGAMGILDPNLWSILIAKWLKYALKQKQKSSLQAAKELLPFFILRSVSFWNSITNMSRESVENIIKKQARLIRNKIK
jgi:hypothetical protein